MYENQIINYDSPFVILNQDADDENTRSVSREDSFTVQRYESGVIHLYELTKPVALWETEPSDLSLSLIKSRLKEVLEIEPSQDDLNALPDLDKVALGKAQKAKRLELTEWLNRPYVDSVKGWTMPIDREARSTMHQYENKQRKKLADGDITDQTANPVLTLSHGVQTLTVAELMALNTRMGDDVEARTFGEALTEAAINAATTVQEVEAITVPVTL